jgi:hypothetical protein
MTGPAGRPRRRVLRAITGRQVPLSKAQQYRVRFNRELPARRARLTAGWYHRRCEHLEKFNRIHLALSPAISIRGPIVRNRFLNSVATGAITATVVGRRCCVTWHTNVSSRSNGFSDHTENALGRTKPTGNLD